MQHLQTNTNCVSFWQSDQCYITAEFFLSTCYCTARISHLNTFFEWFCRGGLGLALHDLKANPNLEAVANQWLTAGDLGHRIKKLRITACIFTSIPLLLCVMTVLGFGVPSPRLSPGLPPSLYYYGWWQCWVLVCLPHDCHWAYLDPFIIMCDDSVGFWCAFPMTVTGLTSIHLLLWVMTVLGFGVPSPWLSLGLPWSLYYYVWWQCWVLVCLPHDCHWVYLHPFIIMGDDSVGFWCAFPMTVTGLTSIPLLLCVMTVLGFGVPSPWLSLGLPRSLYYYVWWQCWVLVCLPHDCHWAYLDPFIIMCDDSVGFWCAFPMTVTGLTSIPLLLWVMTVLGFGVPSPWLSLGLPPSLYYYGWWQCWVLVCLPLDCHRAYLHPFIIMGDDSVGFWCAFPMTVTGLTSIPLLLWVMIVLGFGVPSPWLSLGLPRSLYYYGWW